MSPDYVVASIYRWGNPEFAAYLGGATYVELPFSTCPVDQSEEAEMKRLCPHRTDSEGRAVYIEAPWARPVYDRLIFGSPASDYVVLVRTRELEDILVPANDVASAEDQPQWAVEACTLWNFEGRVRPVHWTGLVGLSSGRIARAVWPWPLDGHEPVVDLETQWAHLEELSLLTGSQDLYGRYDWVAALRGGTIDPRGVVGPLVWVVGTAFALLCCRNVETMDRPPSRQSIRAALREGRPRPFTVKTLVVRPLTRKPDGRFAESAAPLALHWVRGHFKTYSPDRPLFGRLSGTYWWHPHLAGDVSNGVTIKDYRVEA